MKQFTKYWNFLKHLTFKKLLNLFKVTFSYSLSLIIKKPVRLGMPVSISVEPTNFCNLRCPQCPVGLMKLTRYKGFMSFDLYKKIIDQTAPYLLNLFLYFQGEPLLHKDLIKMIRYAANKNIFTGLSTNAQFLTKSIARQLVESRLSYIIISLDGMDQETYEKYRRGGEVKKVMKGIDYLLEARHRLNSATPYIEVQFLVLKTNEHQIHDFRGFCKKKKKITCRLKTAQIEDFSTAHLFVPENKKYARYIFVSGQWRRKKKIKNRCWRLWNSTVITWDGQVLPCCFDKDARYTFGNINDQPLKFLIKNEKFLKFAQTVLIDRKKIDICRNCSE